jgi:putative hemolysin
MEMGFAEWSLAALMPPLLVVSAFCSASETAIFGLSADDRSALRNGAPTASRAAEAMLAEPRQLLITVLLANMSVNTLYFVISSMLIARAGFGALGNLLFGIFTLLFVVLCGEVIPKLVANGQRQRSTRLLAPPLFAVHRAIRPLRRILDTGIIAPLSRLTAPREGPPTIDPDALAVMLEQSGEAGVIDADEQRVLRGVFELRRLRVRDVMTPRVDMAWIESTATRVEVVALAREHRLTRLPVMGQGIDDVIGILPLKRYLLDPRGDATPIVEYLRRVRFVPEVASVEQLLEHFRAYRGELAIVVDEYGGTAGVVALEDCVEEITGDIVSPEEEPERPPEEITPGVWIVPGGANLHRWGEAFGERFLASRASTLGGFVLERLGRPAVVGDIVPLANLRLEVEAVSGHRVRRLLVRIADQRRDARAEASP